MTGVLGPCRRRKLEREVGYIVKGFKYEAKGWDFILRAMDTC